MSGEGQTDELLYSVEDGIARATFNRPQARNALTFAMYEGLAALCGRINDDPEVRALVISGAGGKAFAAGTDIGQFRSFSTPQDPIDYEHRIDRILSTLESCRVPTIASVVGACTGGGAAIAACCDLRIASADARFGFPIARTLGNCLSQTSLARLSALIGPSRVKEMIFTARLLEADEARSVGFLHEVVPDAAALEARTTALARTVAGHAPLTLRATKEGLRRLQPGGAGGEGEDLILMCYTSADFREGIEAFLGKRPPRWQGR
ncbi:Short-chain-enoyl-CoA hydratase [Methylobacterium crusticola]|uniref:Short-chain-enoyl-CoA hydratase n=1 Tax=Methylobacterium crusticola TaxID=1697972 RepID=A0ABQ4R7I0_9HYPH|nr:enoyl-CoA hydratase/isomerase family protein [Methylobacterium crusticola]GJD53678.1 Short-chain-enoyl-CoA hydratase [Methylobacterium crusticola]